MWMNTIFVFIGGGCGTVLRYLTGLLMLRVSLYNLPFATFTVNAAGCFIIGFLYALFISKPELNNSLKLALTAGFCGGLTTFSTFSLELFEMLGNQRFLHAALYTLISILIGLLTVSLGVYLCKVTLNLTN